MNGPKPPVLFGETVTGVPAHTSSNENCKSILTGTYTSTNILATASQPVVGLVTVSVYVVGTVRAVVVGFKVPVDTRLPAGDHV